MTWSGPPLSLTTGDVCLIRFISRTRNMTWMSSAPVTVNLCLHQISRACYLSTLWPALDVSIFMKYFWNISNDLLLLVSLCPTCVRPEVKESSKQFSHRVMSWGSLEQPRADWDPLLRAKSTTYTHSISPDSIFSSGSSPVISIKRIKYSADTASSLEPQSRSEHIDSDYAGVNRSQIYISHMWR